MTTLLDAPPLCTPSRPVAPAPPPPRLRRLRCAPEPGAGPPRPRPVLVAQPAGDLIGTEPAGDPVVTEPASADPDAVRRSLSGSLRAAMEALDGRRPLAQLTGRFEPGPLRYWRAATERRQVRAPARILRIVLCLPRSGAAEVSAVCDIDGRVRALAARFERPGPTAGWRCTALRLG